jgi:hypothetical protein
MGKLTIALTIPKCKLQRTLKENGFILFPDWIIRIDDDY